MRVYIAAVVIFIGACSSATAAAVTIPLPAFEGTIPPFLEATVTFPDDMAEVDSMSIRLTGTLVAGWGQCWGEPEPHPLHYWPHALIILVDSDVPAIWEGWVPSSVPPGDFDYTFAFPAGSYAENWMLAGVTETISLGIYVPNPPCAVGLMPSAEIATAELILWYGDGTPIESKSWTAIRSIFR